MNITECIVSRRSIRKFKDTVPEIDIIDDIISTCAYAPSWKNSQTASYIVIIDGETKQAITDSMDFLPNRASCNSAPVLVVMTTTTGISGYNKDGSYSSVRKDGWQMFDAGIACQTFCLAAHSRGLGTVILGIYNDEAVRKILKIPDDKIITAIIAAGYADQNPTAPKRKDSKELMTIV